ncbi:putative aminopeptidase W07G4.4 [Glandiceps talaboti]
MALLYEIVATNKYKDDAFDGIVLVTDKVSNLGESLEALKKPLEELKKSDDTVDEEVVFTMLTERPFSNQRLVFSPTGPLNRDYDDVRRFYDAANVGMERILKAGSKSPVLVCTTNPAFKNAMLVTVLGALQALYVPLEVREAKPDKNKKVDKLGVWTEQKAKRERVVKIARAFEHGRSVYRDIGGSDPERMAAPRVEEYVNELFKDPASGVSVNVISDEAVLEKEYPLHAAVNRCAKHVDRHKGRIIELEYTGEGEVDTTLMLVGKGVTYDTGGADIKTGGNMRSMHRDKCGSAAVAGFFQILSMLKPKNIKVSGVMTMVRNSVGSDAYVADEIITARSGVRVRVGNTDAEGRMAMADPLNKMKERALNEVKPHIYTIATLTGHAISAVGPNYTVVLDNGPARDANHARRLQKAGGEIGDFLEVSTIRREDYDYHKGKTDYEDVVQIGLSASKSTPRGHQNAAAFLILASGLDKHGVDSESPLRYSHLDIAGSAGPYPGIPTGAPIVALATDYILPRLKQKKEGKDAKEEGEEEEEDDEDTKE